ncbi:MAG: 2-C-methyl-D-erythritol 4-phosphate cytidylyltransferase [Clostridiales bacterium]|nr:2-C-methyl-D-erythritol 4-phosphate cytidylyltransferase [Clostridiales bacterium]
MSVQLSWSKPKQRGKREQLYCSVVVPAAGNARRMEGTDKILARLGDRPVIVHTLLALQACPRVNEIVVVTREDLMSPISDLVRAWDCTKVSRIVRGGETRAESVWIGMSRVNPQAQLIGIHDGARPLVTQAVLEEVFREAASNGAAAPAVPVKDTIKEVNGLETVERTVPRENLRAVQTPQVFDADLIKAALQKALQEQLPLTDDCSAVEALGMKVCLTKGDYNNIKITTPGDLILGEAILSCRPD